MVVFVLNLSFLIQVETLGRLSLGNWGRMDTRDRYVGSSFPHLGETVERTRDLTQNCRHLQLIRVLASAGIFYLTK
jgi:hypothetical protein